MVEPPRPAPPVAGRPGRPLVLDARNTRDGCADTGSATYTVLDDPRRSPADRPERRTGARQRVRLRSGKVLDTQGRFITECVLYDLSPAGSRIRPTAGCALPDDLYLFDDRTGLLHRATVLWRNGRDAGVRFQAQPLSTRMRAVASTMRRKFYAVTR